ncbi:MAG TPA: hypothetical protein VGP07_21330 [Polyangia bacterium]
MTFAPSVIETPLNPSPRRLMQRPADAVEVYSSTPPSRPHVDLALLEVDQYEGQGSPVMVQVLRERAGAMGCDAVFIGEARTRGSGGSLSATCVVYTNVVYVQPDVAADPSPSPSPPLPLPPPGGRRLCRDRQDFEESRDCVLQRGS